MAMETPNGVEQRRETTTSAAAAAEEEQEQEEEEESQEEAQHIGNRRLESGRWRAARAMEPNALTVADRLGPTSIARVPVSGEPRDR